MALNRAVEISQGRGLFRNTRPGPGLQSSGECLMHSLFSEIQISKETHERRQNPARFRSVKVSIVLLSCSDTGGGIYAKLANGVPRHNGARNSGSCLSLPTLSAYVCGPPRLWVKEPQKHQPQGRGGPLRYTEEIKTPPN